MGVIIRRRFVDTREQHDAAVARYEADGLEVKAADADDGYGWTTLVRPGVEERSSRPWWIRVRWIWRIESAVVHYGSLMDGKRFLVRL